jgi:hypothetical protein
MRTATKETHARMADTRETGAFDERAALEQLERFREEITRERARRRAVSDEFESFVRSFKTPAAPKPAAQAPSPTPPASPRAGVPLPPKPTPPPVRPEPARPAPAHPAPARPAPSRIELPRAPKIEVPSPPMLPVDPHAVFPTEIDPRMPAPPRRRRLALVMLAVLVIGVLAAWALWPGSSSPATEVTDTSAPAPAGAVTQPATDEGVASPTAPPAPAPENLVTELTTTRNVWVRVIADGERVVERELPAGSRIPFSAQKTIVIRTGDAGAVTLTIAGEDQGPLGREGQVVTRTFTVPER